MRFHTPAALMIALLLANAAQAVPLGVSPSGVPAISEDMLSAEYWIRRAPSPDVTLRSKVQLAAQRKAAYASGGGFIDLAALPSALTREQITEWLRQAEQSPVKLAVDDKGQPVSDALIDALRRNTATESVTAAQARYGLSVRRSPMRTLPSDRRYFAADDQRDYESLTAGVLFPGEPVLIAHHSADRAWLLVVTTQGPAWVKATDIAEGSAASVFAYAAREPSRVVTGEQVRTVYTPEAPEVSEVDLDMGLALPRADVPPGEPVNGASSVASWVVQLPVRQADGTLAIRSALLRRTADTSAGYLPLTRANILRQAFKFLGERYGWGHQFNARDCSGLTSEVYRSMGVLLQHSSSIQGTSTALRHRTFGEKDTHAERVRALAKAQVGDLIVVPGHVLMIVGHVNGEPYVIQDVPYAIFDDPTSGQRRRTKLNQVSVTPLLPLYADDKTLYVDAMTSLVQATRQ